MKENYFKRVFVIENILKHFINVMESELERMKIIDISNVQCSILYNIGMQKIIINNLINYKYYLGSNVSYNLNKMIKNGYVIKEKRSDDNRSSYVYLSKKGIKFYKKLKDLFTMHEKCLFQDIDKKKLDHLDSTLIALENFWINLQKRD